MDLDKYFRELAKALAKLDVRLESGMEKLWTRSPTRWSCKGVVHFQYGSLRVSEYGMIDPKTQRPVLERFTYNFAPVSALFSSWRVDLHPTHGLHANPDEKLEDLAHHLRAGDLSLNIQEFSFLVALYVTAGYMKTGTYPLGPAGGKTYNAIIRQVGRTIS